MAKAIEKYVDEKNLMSKFFNYPLLSLANAEDRKQLARSLESDLSPEALTCDGERPRAQVRARHKYLTQAAAQLQKLDPAITFDYI